MWHYVNRVTVIATGTPVQVTADHYPCQTLLFQQVQGNTGKLYICDRATANITTGVGVLAMLPPPSMGATYASVLPYVSVTVPSAPAALNANKFWIDADVNSDKCQVSAVRN